MRNLLRNFIPILTLTFFISCGDASTGSDTDPDPDPDPEPTTGTIEITTSTSGEDQDDGYILTLGDKEEDISANETLIFEDLEEDSYEVEITDIADNCSVGGDNPRSVEVTADETTSETFEVVCESTGEEKIVYHHGGELLKMNPDGSGEKTIIERSGSEYHAVSNDGTKIAFADSDNIYVMNSDGSDVQEIETDLILNSPRNLSWSPDNKKVAFMTYKSEGDQVYTIDVETGETQLITRGDMTGEDPDWAPNSNNIIFSSPASDDPGALNDLYIANLDDDNIEQFTNTPDLHEKNPSWSPDGEKIAFSNLSGISTSPADDFIEEEVVSSLGNAAVNWSPDGEKLVYMDRNEAADSEKMFTINADGSGEKDELVWTSHNLIHEPEWAILIIE